MSGDTVLVTGAGYVGSRACKAHARAGYTPVTYDNIASGNRWAVRWGLLEFGDILDAGRLYEMCKKYRPIAIMHFAASALVGESMATPSLYYLDRNGLSRLCRDCCPKSAPPPWLELPSAAARRRRLHRQGARRVTRS